MGRSGITSGGSEVTQSCRVAETRRKTWVREEAWSVTEDLDRALYILVGEEIASSFEIYR